MGMENKILNVAVVRDRLSRNRSLYVDDIYDIVEKLFKFDPATELGVLQKCGSMARSWNIAAINEEIHFEKELDKYVGQKFRLSTGYVIVVSRAYEKFTNIVVKDVPPHWGSDTVERIFKNYGRINETKQEQFRFGVIDCKAAYREVWNGNWRLSILLDKSIPSTLMIDGHRIEVYYRGQPKTCFNCGGNHFFYENKCNQEHLNRFRLEEFPELTPSQIQVVEGGDGELTPERDGGIGEQNGEERNKEMEQVVEETKTDEQSGEGSDKEMKQASKDVETPLLQEPLKEKEPGENTDIGVLESWLDEMDKIVQVPLDPTPPKKGNITEAAEKVTQEDVDSKIEEKLAGEDDISQEVGKVIAVEVLHRDCSQEVKGAMTSPKETYQFEELLSGIILSDGSQLIVEEEMSPEHTDTAITETASEAEKDVVQASPSSFPQDSRLTPGQKNGKEIDNEIDSTDAMETEMEKSSGQLLDSLVTEMRGSLTPPKPPDSGNKRQRMQGVSTEDDSDNGFKKVGVGPVGKSPTNRSKKKSRPEDKK